jgi:serine/threonine protein kinase
MPVGEPEPPADPLVGRVLSDRYRIVRKIGEGGMGVVYQAEHALIGKKVALKVLFPELTRRTDLVARFLQEARSASRIGHENVIDISDFGQSPDGLVYIAMEYLEGEDLGRLIKTTGPLPWERARPILMQIAKGLRAAHDHGIIHRDMKPENIFLTQREGYPDFVKVLDFGIAKVVNLDEDGPRLTQTGMIFGTPEYMSPEQAQGQTPDHRVDIYAVGCIMYHLLTGQAPFVADTFMGILTKHMLEPVIPLRKRRPDLEISEEVEAIAMRAMEKDRDKRWQDMNAFYRAMGAVGAEAFEPSGPFPPRASLKYPELAEPNPAVQKARTQVFGGSSMPAEDDHLEERPGRAETPGGRGKLIISVALAAVVVVAVAVAAVLSSRSARIEVQTPPVVAPTAAPAAAAATGAVLDKGGAAAAASSGNVVVPVVPAVPDGPEAAAGGATKPAAATVRTRRRSSADAVRALGGVVDEGKAGAEGKSDKARAITPPELKDPFKNP